MVYDGMNPRMRCRFNGWHLPSRGRPAFGRSRHTEPIMTRPLCRGGGLHSPVRRPPGSSSTASAPVPDQGFRGLGGLRDAGHTRRFTDDPSATAVHHRLQPLRRPRPHLRPLPHGVRGREDLRGTRSEHKLSGHRAWPCTPPGRRKPTVLGLVAEDHHITSPCATPGGDGRVLARGDFGMGGLHGVIECDVSGVDTLRLRLTCPPLLTEQQDPFDSKQGLFWDAALTLTTAPGCPERAGPLGGRHRRGLRYRPGLRGRTGVLHRGKDARRDSVTPLTSAGGCLTIDLRGCRLSGFRGSWRGRLSRG